MKILWKRGEIAPQEQFHLFSIIFCNLMVDFYVKIRTRFSLQDKRLFELIKVEITRVDCIWISNRFKGYNSWTTKASLTKLYVHQCHIVIYIHFMFHKNRFRGYLVIANYMDFKSIQGL